MNEKRGRNDVIITRTGAGGGKAVFRLQPSSSGVGADQPIKLSPHCCWEELQALSAPQGGQS